MTSFLRSILPISPSNLDVEIEEDEYNVEYSFAMEYTGPPVTYDIPWAVPVDVNQIPTAAEAATASMLNNLSLPIIQPIVKSDPLGKKFSKELTLGLEAIVSPISGNHMCKLDCSGAKSLNMVDNSSDERIESSGTLGFSDSRDVSRDLSGSSDAEGIHRDCEEEGVGFGNYSNESGLSSPTLSSKGSSCKGEDCIDETHGHHNRIAIVTFRDPESHYIVQVETDHDAPNIIQERKEAKSKVKKGLCHRCLKGNRFVEKEVCIVCSAKYCSSCVLRAMGSMPEGRKCIPCIGSWIDESKRETLGKCSRMLKRLLTDWEVEKIMSNEISSEVNQIPHLLVCVNGKPLSHDELVLLQRCQNPPKKLKPGKYWYDKVSGFWGKEGQKPCQIISSQLTVGDGIVRHASNGNTNILINGREITKAELWMLQLAGIHCEGNPHFWVSADGSYQEEGQRNVMGRIWDKTGIKLVCAVLSLPIPSESINSCGEEADNVANKVGPDHLEPKTLNKFLLVGYAQSGTSTIFKQTKIIYNAPFSEDERQNVKFMIQRNLYGYLGILLEAREKFEEEGLIERRKRCFDRPCHSGNSDQTGEKNVYSISPKLKAFSDWLLQVMMLGNLEAIFPAATREYAPLVEELWKDKALQATYNRRNELDMLPKASNHFLSRAVEISRTDYEPSDMDILYAGAITSSNGLASTEFSFPKSMQDSFMDPADQNDPLLRYQLIRVHASSLGEKCKWIEMFEDVDLILYCVSLTDYDQFSTDINGVSTNKMLASKKLFESIVTHPTFEQKNFLLILTKFDLLEEKIEQVPLTQCDWFHDFNPVISVHPNGCNYNNNNPSLPQRAFHYIAVKFKRLFHSLTERKLYVSLVTGLEPTSVDEALRYGREILKWEEEKPNAINANELSSSSIDASSSS